jgi:arylsulfatase A
MTSAKAGKNLTRRGFLAATTATTAALAAASGPSAAEAGATAQRRSDVRQDRPNLIVIMADDLGRGELGAFGQQLIHTPNLDRMAAEGMRFTGFYSGAPVCAPSRSVLLTGLHIGHAPVRENPPGGAGTDLPLGPEDVTFGKILQSAGYRTGLIGKWGFGPELGDQPSHPNAQGFAEFFGHMSHLHAQEYYPTYLWENGTRIDIPENAAGAKQVFAPDLFIARAVDFIGRHQNEPFLLYFSPNLPHAPHDIPSLAPYEDEAWPQQMKAHAAQVTHLDGHVGQVLDKLQELGIADNTMVLFFSDNGPHEAGSPRLDPDFFDANGPLRGYKRNLYEGGIRSPMIAWSPGRLRNPGSTNDHTWAAWDILPTLAELAHAEPADGIDGRSMRQLLTGVSWLAPEHEYLFWSRLHETASPKADAEEKGRLTHAADAIRFGHWKAIRIAPGVERSAPDEEWDLELYDLHTDPGETTEVSTSHPRVAGRARRYMKEAWVDLAPPPATTARSGTQSGAGGAGGAGGAADSD